MWRENGQKRKLLNYLQDEHVACSIPENAYQFLILNKNSKSSPSDKKLKDTIMAIIEAFFIRNPYILLYICETGDRKQAARNRLFVRWFNDSKRQKEFYFRDVNIKPRELTILLLS